METTTQASGPIHSFCKRGKQSPREGKGLAQDGTANDGKGRAPSLRLLSSAILPVRADNNKMLFGFQNAVE